MYTSLTFVKKKVKKTRNNKNQPQERDLANNKKLCWNTIYTERIRNDICDLNAL